MSPELALNLNSLQNLDLSHNDLTAVPVTVYSFLKLRRLSLAFNPITVISNESFYGISDSLVELNLMGLQPHAFEVSYSLEDEVNLSNNFGGVIDWNT